MSPTAHRRLAMMLAAAWLGTLLSIGLLAAPSAFKVLDRQAAGALVARLFALEAPLSLLLALGVLLLERWRFRAEGLAVTVSLPILLALAALFCTVAGYYALQPLMDQARAGQGSWSFAQLHAVSLMLYGCKVVAVGWLAWEASRDIKPS